MQISYPKEIHIPQTKLERNFKFCINISDFGGNKQLWLWLKLFRKTIINKLINLYKVYK